MAAQSLLERFEEKYIPEPNSGCWLWTATSVRGGYGMIKSGDKNHLAHRVSWSLYRGDIPDEMLVCHSCDTPACVNPDHLFLGSQKDNMRDMLSKDRLPSRKGSKNPRAKLSESDIDEIRIALKNETKASIASRYGVSPSLIRFIELGDAWAHI